MCRGPRGTISLILLNYNWHIANKTWISLKMFLTFCWTPGLGWAREGKENRNEVETSYLRGCKRTMIDQSLILLHSTAFSWREGRGFKSQPLTITSHYWQILLHWSSMRQKRHHCKLFRLWPVLFEDSPHLGVGHANMDSNHRLAHPSWLNVASRLVAMPTPLWGIPTNYYGSKMQTTPGPPWKTAQGRLLY